ncbi:MAG TPA: hypothetical protein VIW71_17280 [Streptomyces sp.]
MVTSSDATAPDAVSVQAAERPGTGVPGPDDPPPIVPRRHVGRRLTAAAALLVFAMVVNSVVRNRAFQWDALLTVATLWYVAVTTVLSAGQFYVERYYARGAARALPPTPLQRLRVHLAVPRARLRAVTAADARPAIGGDR